MGVIINTPSGGGVDGWTLLDSVSHTGTSGSTPKNVTLPSGATEFLLIVKWGTTIYASVVLPTSLSTTTTRAGFIDGTTTKIAAALSASGTKLIAIIDNLSTSGTVTAYLYYR